MSDAHRQGACALRGHIVHCLDKPADAIGLAPPASIEQIEDGLVLIQDGRVSALGPTAKMRKRLPKDCKVHEHPGELIVPGFVDAHVHYPQTNIIASHGEQLLGWLERYTFPEEAKFEDADYARETAGFFVRELLRNGTTSALVFATVHPQSVTAIFEAANARSLRLAAGKVLMDRNCPPELQDTAQSGYADSKALIERWHGKGRLHYAITPRFAPTSSPEQLRRAGELAAEYPDVFIQSHVAENAEELKWVAELFPDCRSYLDVYDRFGLLRERAVYAHCIELDAQDRARMAETGAAMAFCPTSNLFLGNGMFDLEASGDVRVGLATDVGGGTSFSMLQTAAEAYKVLRQHAQSLSPWHALYLMTLGGARALHLDAHIGNFAPGKEADIVVLDPRSTPLLERRTERAESLGEVLFACLTLGDERAVKATYIMGARV